MNFKLSYALMACLAVTTVIVDAKPTATTTGVAQSRTGNTSYRPQGYAMAPIKGSNTNTYQQQQQQQQQQQPQPKQQPQQQYQQKPRQLSTTGIKMHAGARREMSGFAPPENLRPMAPSGSDGGITTVDNAAMSKQAINDGVASVLGQDKYAQSLAQGAASLETGFGKDMPTEQDQRAHGKFGQEKQEFGTMRMNRHMLRELGYQEWQMWKMNEASYAGRKLAGEAFARAIQKFGLYNFMHYQRGGESRLQRAVAGKLWGGESEDTYRLLNSYQKNQVTLLNNDLYKQNSNQVPWTYGPQRM